MTTNPNRVIKLYLSDKPIEQGNWRTNLSRIINDAQREGTNVELFNVSDSDVKESVELVMASAPKSPVTRNVFTTPVSTFVGSVTSGGSSLLGKLSSLASYGINILSSWNDVMTHDANTNGRTAQIFQPWTKNVKAWGSSEGGITFEYEFKFNMGQYGLWNAKEEVVKPIINLVAPAFPQYLDNWSMAGPFPSTSELLLRLIKDNFSSVDSTSSVANITSTVASTMTEYKNILSDDSKSLSDTVLNTLQSIGTVFKELINSAYKNLTFTMEFGKIIRFDKLIITNATTSFSNEVDQDGYPISGTAKLTFEGLVPLALINNTGYGETQMFPADVKYGEV